MSLHGSLTLLTPCKRYKYTAPALLTLMEFPAWPLMTSRFRAGREKLKLQAGGFPSTHGETGNPMATKISVGVIHRDGLPSPPGVHKIPQSFITVCRPPSSYDFEAKDLSALWNKLQARPTLG